MSVTYYEIMIYFKIKNKMDEWMERGMDRIVIKRE